jgi:hypothetical protein
VKHGSGEVAASAGTAYCKFLRVEAEEVRAGCVEPDENFPRVVDGCRVGVFWGEAAKFVRFVGRRENRRCGVKGERGIPIINSDNHASRPLTQMRTNRILRLNIPQHPPTPMIIHHSRPSPLRPLTLRREDPNWDIRSLSLSSMEGEILCFSNREFGPAARD